ncbi:cytochrome c3 family protein [Myxococcus sp. RHSTA-1-4]|uniref:cytochrome c3 family protein n=1 Tax=Myxococcus sp. RHSTA-1-4 TaxID=2874601 RepID=UPI001CBC0FBD|nr:cytochrome c3 family protein [Myxococcus sp. RHSTA-1-4]MBZ4418100.1 cytochrome c3 family protein [Myxococcus sp. RHSTA-1-4]
MTQLPKSLLFAVLVLAAGCDVLNTSDAEGTRGRGARAFDPYSSSASGAIALSLLYFNGCAMLPNGEPVSAGSLTLPDYPTACQPLNGGIPLKAPRVPTARIRVTPGVSYFLREFTAVDAVFNAHIDFTNRHAAAFWMRKESRFKDLDWSGLSIGRDEWTNDSDTTFDRETYYENAAWMLSLDDTILLEVMDADGTVRASTTYKRTDFLAESPTTGRTRASWTVAGIGRPRFPGDNQVNLLPDGDEPTYKTLVKVSFSGSTDPFKSFTMPQLSGEGVIRLTWSLLPGKPFLFPVTFAPEQERQATCYRLGEDGFATDEQVPCGFGLEQAVRLSRPANGSYFMPGESVSFAVSLRDGEGHGLHPRAVMPSYNAFIAEESNGLAYFNTNMHGTYRDASATESGFKVVGPLQELRPSRGTYDLPYFSHPLQSEPQFYLPPGLDGLAGGGDAMPPTTYSVQLPPDAKPGTYAILLKGHRSFMGERLNRLDPFFFQVGQDKPTTYPGRVGNCQVCHNGVNSLSNVYHGMSVDHVESCQACHVEEAFGYLPDVIHRMHFNSRKYNQNKGDCTLCHLTRESTLWPSQMNCDGCHLQSHGVEYFDLRFEPFQNTPNAYGNCAQACHVTTPPAEHVLPAR